MHDEKIEELLLPVDAIEWDLQDACNDCPFKKTTPAHEGIAKSIPFYCDTIEANRFSHTCHKTDNRQSVDGPRNYGGKPKHCFGAIMMLLRTGNGKDLQIPLLEAAQDKKLDIQALAERAKTDDRFHTLPELVRFYANWIGEKVKQLQRARDE